MSFSLRKSQKNTLKNARKFLEENKKRAKESNTSKTESNDKTPTTSPFSKSTFSNKPEKCEPTHAQKVMAYFLDKNGNI